ncbi:proteinase-activated receptor 2-like [Heptranchias perlo]|uniref:proteinase-activated receptor 2-like n=1 Tax=Heptranchias perlo TaxID=212740 RepID=UPI0035596D1A
MDETVPAVGRLPAIPLPSSDGVNLSDQARAQLTSPINTKLIPAIYILVFVIGLPANAMALWIMAAKSKKPSTIFLINLATTDLLLILMLPFKISYHLLGNDWRFGEGLCRTMTAFFYGNMYCSILLLTFISIDRYFALVHPFISRRFRDNTFAVVACIVIWVIVILFVLPFLFVKQCFEIPDLGITSCHDVYLKDNEIVQFHYWLAVVVLGFFIPSFITIFCYISVIKCLMVNETKYRKAVKITILILFMYLVCFTPSNTVLLVHQWVPELHTCYMSFLSLSSFNSCIDPFIYYYISDEFRNKVKMVLCFQKVGTRELNLQPSTMLELTSPMISSPSSSSTLCREYLSHSDNEAPRMDPKSVLN